MIKTIEFYGRNVVAPITGKGMEMVAPLEEYFVVMAGAVGREFDSPNEAIDWWFSLGEQRKKDCIRSFFDHKCIFCEKSVETNEVHEIVGKGSAGGKPALVPWNQVPPCREHHELLQQYKWTIYRFDPLDKENGLIVIGQDGHPILKDKLWFYQRPDEEIVEEAHAKFQQMQEILLANRSNEALFIEDSAWMSAHKGAEALGLGTHKAMLAQIGMDISKDKRHGKIYERAMDRGIWDKIKSIDLDHAYKILKKVKVDDDYEWLVPNDEVDDWIADAGVLATTDFNHKFADRFAGGYRQKKRYAINGQAYEIEPEDPAQGADADIIISGGKVIKGEVGERG